MTERPVFTRTRTLQSSVGSVGDDEGGRMTDVSLGDKGLYTYTSTHAQTQLGWQDPQYVCGYVLTRNLITVDGKAKKKVGCVCVCVCVGVCVCL
jgi:hypothetical protein